VALEAAPYGVTCNLVSPGHVDTTGQRFGFVRGVEEGAAASVDEAMAEHAERLAQSRFIEADEIAATVAFLCSDNAKNFTTENLRQSGAMLW
jgi:NAD(P)-dependent dehydrogenase (short-subunit alcohol dehydrogenase family)